MRKKLYNNNDKIKANDARIEERKEFMKQIKAMGQQSTNGVFETIRNKLNTKSDMGIDKDEDIDKGR